MYTPVKEIDYKYKNYTVAGIDIRYNYYLNKYDKIHYIEYHIGRPIDDKFELGYFRYTLCKIYLIPMSFYCNSFIDYILNKGGQDKLYKSVMDIYLDYARYYLGRDLTPNEIQILLDIKFGTELPNTIELLYAIDDPNRELQILKQLEKFKENN